VPGSFPYTGVALDLDGVVWLGDQPIPGSAAAVRRLHSAGVTVVYVTNMSGLTIADQEAKLARHGVSAADSVVTSAAAAASLLEAGERVLVCGGPGVVEAVESAGATAVDGTGATREQAETGGESLDAVVVGYHTSFDYWTMARASRAVREGARLIGTNHDPTYPTESGLQPGGGAILAAIATAAETAPIVAGKPHQPAADLTIARLGGRPLMVGDRPDTDGAFATTMGCDFGLVLSGVVSRGDLPVRPEPAHVADDLETLVDELLKSS
jgi:HAD superfamily hydrolase (TIGR01450 family)